MDLTNLYALSASDGARLIRDGVISSAQLVEACLSRIEAVDPDVRAWTFLDPDLARAQAAAADEYRLSGRPLGPLHGVPVGVKDIIDTADMPTENGSVLHAGRTPSRDATVVSALRAAGAVIVGKTVTTEFAAYAPGKTRNPHNPAHTPGGSSSGSAAAVAAGMVPIALGSQTNGSVIRPAAFCGVYGFKPTHGLIPRHGVLPLCRSLDTLGVFARTLDDVALVTEELFGFDERDPDSRPRARVPLRVVGAEEPPITPMLAFIKTARWDRADGDTREAFAELAGLLGDRMEEIELVQCADAFEWHRLIMESEMAASLDREWTVGRDRLSDALRTQIGRGREITAVDYQLARRRAEAFAEGLAELFQERCDAILTPAAPGPAPHGLESTGDPSFCTLWTLTGMPAITLPLMHAPNGLPIGIQLVGARHGDARLLRTARWLASRIEAS
jgi:Asp-tRNA(Asn)/Glu-tRNA(Gln) amidotransferase A subunit family amidase